MRRLGVSNHDAIANHDGQSPSVLEPDANPVRLHDSRIPSTRDAVLTGIVRRRNALAGIWTGARRSRSLPVVGRGLRLAGLKSSAITQHPVRGAIKRAAREFG